MKLMLLTILLYGVSFTALADSFRCGSRVVLTGESTGEVIAKCGQPMLREELGYKKTADDYVKVERVYFDLGKGKFLKILEFHNGRLVAIKNGARQ